MNTKMNAKKWLLAAGAVILGVALFLAGTTFAQTDEGDSGHGWSEMMDGEGWEHRSMHTSSEGVECPYYAHHTNHMKGMDGREQHHGAMHGAYGRMMGDWVQPERDPDAPAGEPGA